MIPGIIFLSELYQPLQPGTAHHGPASLYELSVQGHEPHTSHVLPCGFHILHHQRVLKDIPEGISILGVIIHEINGKTYDARFIGDHQRLAACASPGHLVQGQERRPAVIVLLQEFNGPCPGGVVLCDHRLHSPSRRSGQRGLVFVIHLGKLGDRPVYPGKLVLVPCIQHLFDRYTVPRFLGHAPLYPQFLILLADP